MHAAFGHAASHEDAWNYLREQAFDVALLQETRDPADYADWCSTVWRPKHAKAGSRHPLWGSAVIARSADLREPEIDEGFPWLRELKGSAAVACMAEDPVWLASVHADYRPIARAKLEELGHDQVPVSTPNGSVGETDVIPFELRCLFGDESFIWGGDLNSAVIMDQNPSFTGGNGKLRGIWKEAGSYDLRLKFFKEEQPTYFAPGKKRYQLDHVFADEATKECVTDWNVDVDPVERNPPLSDHAPIIVDIDPPGTG